MPQLDTSAGLTKAVRKRLKTTTRGGMGLRTLLQKFKNAPFSEWGKIAKAHKARRAKVS